MIFVGLKLAILLTCIGVIGIIFTPFYFTLPNPTPYYEWLVFTWPIGGAVLTFIGIKIIILEMKMKKFLNQRKYN